MYCEFSSDRARSLLHYLHAVPWQYRDEIVQLAEQMARILHDMLLSSYGQSWYC